MQVPANFDHVSHATAAEIAQESPFREALDGHVRDVTGNGHDGQIHGNVKYINGPNGQAIDLDGSAWVTCTVKRWTGATWAS